MMTRGTQNPYRSIEVAHEQTEGRARTKKVPSHSTLGRLKECQPIFPLLMI